MYWDVPSVEERERLLTEAVANPSLAWRRYMPNHSTEPQLKDSVRSWVFSAVGRIVGEATTDKRFRMESYTEQTWSAVLSSATGGSPASQLELVRLLRAWARELSQRDHEERLLHDERADCDYYADEWGDTDDLCGSLMWLSCLTSFGAANRLSRIRLLRELHGVPLSLRDHQWHRASSQGAAYIPQSDTVDEWRTHCGMQPVAAPPEEPPAADPDTLMATLLSAPEQGPPPALPELPPIPPLRAPERDPNRILAPWALADEDALSADSKKAFGSLCGKLRLKAWPNTTDLKQRLLSEFPWLTAAVDAITEDLELQESVGDGRGYSWRPLVLLGPPGSGKSRLATRIMEIHGGSMLSCAGMSDNRSLAGTPRGWSSASPSAPSLAAHRLKLANPVMVLDEADKMGGGKLNGDPAETLLGMLERTTSRSLMDEGLGVPCDMSRVNWILTANRRDQIPALVRTRLRFVECPPPRPEDFGALLRGCLQDIADELGIHPSHLPMLTDDVIGEIERGYVRGRLSARTLARVVRTAVGAAGRAEKAMPRH